MRTALMNRCLAISLLLYLTVGCDKAVKTSAPTISMLVFLSNRESAKGRFDIFMMQANGSQPENLTRNAHPVRSISAPLLSPDKKEVLFTCFDAEGPALALLDLQTRAVRRLTRVDQDLPGACFSPDGDMILFVKKVSGRRQIYRIRRDGSGEQNLSNTPFDEFDADFSFDAKKIVYISKRTTPASVWWMRIDGSEAQPIVAGAGECRHPCLSPDGKTVVFQSIVKGDNDIYLARIGGQAEVLFTSGFNETRPYFADNGRKVIFLSNLRGMKYQDLIAFDVQTRKALSLTDQLNVINQNPRVSADGKKIVFESIAFGNTEVFIVDVDEKRPGNLTHHSGWDCSPAF